MRMRTLGRPALGRSVVGAAMSSRKGVTICSYPDSAAGGRFERMRHVGCLFSLTTCGFCPWRRDPVMEGCGQFSLQTLKPLCPRSPRRPLARNPLSRTSSNTWRCCSIRTGPASRCPAPFSPTTLCTPPSWKGIFCPSLAVRRLRAGDSESGDYRTYQIGPYPIFILRQDDGSIAPSFHNTCRHRGARVLQQSSERGRREARLPLSPLELRHERTGHRLRSFAGSREPAGSAG